MHEAPTLLHARWKPGTFETLTVQFGDRAEDKVEEWPLSRFRTQFGKAAVAQLYLTGRTEVRLTLPLPDAAD